MKAAWMVPVITAVMAGAAAPSAIAQAPAASADLIITNARIYTVDDARPVVAAMAVRAGRVAFAGDARGAMTLRGPQTRVVDLGGRTVIPGMVDSHAHVAGLGDALANVDLVGSTSEDDVIARVVAKARGVPAGQWITGRGWDQNRWGDTRFPTHDKLSAALPNNPVVLTRVDGHASYANRKAMYSRPSRPRRGIPKAGRSCATPTAARPACSLTTRWGW